MSSATRVYVFDDFDIFDGEWVKSYSPSKNITHRTLSYRRWLDIETRCKIGSKFQERRPSYIGSLNGFESFQHFVEWSLSECGYDNLDKVGSIYSLDKDILSESKVYNPENCIFVPKRINNFVLKSEANRGHYPIGVYLHSNSGKFHAKVKDGASVRSLGYYKTPMEAHRAWQFAKCKIAYDLAIEYSWHKRLSDGLVTYADNIMDDYLSNVETI